MKTYHVNQTFELISVPSITNHDSLSEAEAAAAELRESLTELVAARPTFETKPTGSSTEANAWNHAAEIAGVTYDEKDGKRTADSPKIWGRYAAAYIAGEAVVVDESDDDEGEGDPG